MIIDREEGEDITESLYFYQKIYIKKKMWKNIQESKYINH